jgi:hypothetical protein
LRLGCFPKTQFGSGQPRKAKEKKKKKKKKKRSDLNFFVLQKIIATKILLFVSVGWSLGKTSNDDWKVQNLFLVSGVTVLSPFSPSSPLFFTPKKLVSLQHQDILIVSPFIDA